MEVCGCGRTAVAGKTAFPGAGNGGDQSGDVTDTANPVVVGVRYEKVAIGIKHGEFGAGKLGLIRKDVVGVIASLASTRDGPNDSGFSINAAHPVVAEVHDHHVTVGSFGYPARQIEPGQRGQSSITDASTAS